MLVDRGVSDCALCRAVITEYVVLEAQGKKKEKRRC
jgi:hypothetical protein